MQHPVSTFNDPDFSSSRKSRSSALRIFHRKEAGRTTLLRLADSVPPIPSAVFPLFLGGWLPAFRFWYWRRIRSIFPVYFRFRPWAAGTFNDIGIFFSRTSCPVGHAEEFFGASSMKSSRSIHNSRLNAIS